ncbi:MAG: hypothetical protein QNJ81_02135 [Acidimicrobiia bacterium]|nr:hypothetical protein [Acidimicrobiia bacterium]
MITLPDTRLVIWEDYDQIDLDWAESKYEPNGMTAFCLDDSPDEWVKHQPFTDFIQSLYDFEIQIISRYVGIWRLDSVSLKDPRYCHGFPHRHNNDLTTISLIIQAPESGGANVLEGEITEPVPGHGLIIGGQEEHGVLRVFGTRPRIAVIAQFDRR